MPITTTGSVAVEVPPGSQVEFRITDAEFDPNGKYGPRLPLDLIIIDERYFGVAMKYWSPLQQTRLDKVRKLRKEDLDDETIESILRKQGLEFDSIDDPEMPTVNRGGNTYKILVAVTGSTKAAEAALQRCDSFDELAALLIDGTFVGSTKMSSDGKYVQLDGTEEIYPPANTVFAEQQKTEAEIDELPDDPPPAF